MVSSSAVGGLNRTRRDGDVGEVEEDADEVDDRWSSR
mgnify:CR=1 FL=1